MLAILAQKQTRW